MQPGDAAGMNAPPSAGVAGLVQREAQGVDVALHGGGADVAHRALAVRRHDVRAGLPAVLRDRQLGGRLEVVDAPRRRLATEAVEALADVVDEAGLAHLAVGDDVDPRAVLHRHDVVDGVGDRGLELGGLALALLVQVHQPGQGLGPGQAADMGGPHGHRVGSSLGSGGVVACGEGVGAEALEGGDLRQHREPVRARDARVELLVDVEHVLGEAAVLGEVGELPELDRGDRVVDVHAVLEPPARLGLHRDQVLPHHRDLGLAADRTVTGDDRVHLEVEDEVERGDPAVDRARPGDRGAADEQDVAGVEQPGVRHVDERVAGRVRGTDLDQAHLAAADVDALLAGERPVRPGRGDALELEGPEDVPGELAERAVQVLDLRDGVEGLLRHQLGGRGGGEDLDVPRGDELVAVDVVGIRVGVHQRPEGVGVGDRPDPVEHLPGQREVEQRVDHQRGARPRDQAGVAPAPAAVGLQPGVAALAEVVESSAVVLGAHAGRPLGVLSQVRSRCAGA